MIDRSRVTAYLIGDQIERHHCTDDDEEVIENTARTKFREFENKVKKIQKSFEEKKDGFILYQDNVYQVYAVNGIVKKITGGLAKDVKRQLKANT